MGVLNVTPDSFSDGGVHLEPATAAAGALRMLDEGAAIIDIGGESTRPGAAPVPLDEELHRVVPVVEGLANQTSTPLSIDTYKAEVARTCLVAGAHIINDITALRGDPAMADVVKEFQAGAILMHMQGTPDTMQIDPRYEDVAAEVGAFFEERLQTLASFGIAEECLILDPGVGFGKTSSHNLTLLARLQEFQRFGRPICLGVSRKGFLGATLARSGKPLPAEERIWGTAATVAASILNGAHIVRVHDVHEMVQVARVADCLLHQGRRFASRSTNA
jgi:dihydropteroate synthase